MQKASLADDGKKTTRIAKLFQNGKNQSVRLPREFEIQAKEVIIEKQGSRLVLIPKPSTWEDYFASAHRLANDFPDDIEELPFETREGL
ncbi:MAG: type II toxin-antitoxin system VapB family antitoxin [Desulfohalobiaceae bacterium]|nr:type II toxin-antitoxin system VapB family antitoxin [Desulfohalobiaceae bacterium]